MVSSGFKHGYCLRMPIPVGYSAAASFEGSPVLSPFFPLGSFLEQGTIVEQRSRDYTTRPSLLSILLDVFPIVHGEATNHSS